MVEAKKLLLRLFLRLEDHFGDPEWWPARTQLEICVGAILTQNTAWVNVEKAIRNLGDSGIEEVEDYLALDLASLAELIRPSGYFNQKAKKLKLFMQWFQEAYQGDFIKAALTETGILRKQLLNLWGIGPETADAMLCYAFGKPVFVVDVYLKRVLVRHGFVNENVTYDEMQRLVESAVPGDSFVYNKAHARIVETAKRWCGKQRPLCDQCPLGEFL